MTRLVVEAGFGSTVFTPPASITWTEITERVDVANAGVTINRGAADERSESQTSSCTMFLNNQDGAFTPGLASSPYYPLVRKETPIRARVITTAKNLMPNPGFSSGVSDWVSSGTPTRATSTTHMQDGTQAMLITWGAVASQTMTSPLIQGLHIGRTYTYSTYVWVPSGDATVQLSVANGNLGSASTLFDQFQRISVTWTATAVTHQVRVRAVGTPTAGDVVWVDAGQIEEAAAPTTYDGTGPRTHNRFWGSVTEWPPKWKGLYAFAQITCTDLLPLLSRQPNLRCCLDEEILADAPLAFYPLTEPSDSTTAGDLSGITAGALAITQVSVGGTLEFAAGTGAPSTGEQVPLFTPASASAGKVLSADLGEEFDARSTGGWTSVEGWFTTSTAGRVIVGLTSADSQFQLVFSLSAGGVLQVEYVIDGAGPLTVVTSSSANLADGAPHHFAYDEYSNALYVDGVAVTLAAVQEMYRLRQITIGGFKNARLFSGSIGHLALYTSSGATGAMLAQHYQAGFDGYAGETADVRIQRLASYTKIPSVTVVGSTHDPVTGQASAGSTALAKMREVEKTESGKLYAERDWFGLAYQSRDVRYNPDPSSEVFTIAWGDLDTDEIEIRHDSQKQVNQITGTRPGGARQRVTSEASIALYGPLDPGEQNLLKTSDNAVLDAMNWLVSRYADPDPEIREVPIDAYSLPIYADILDGDISEQFSITSAATQAPASSARLTIEGYTETIKHNWHRLQFHTSAAVTDSVWVLDDPSYSILGSTTRLAY